MSAKVISLDARPAAEPIAQHIRILVSARIFVLRGAPDEALRHALDAIEHATWVAAVKTDESRARFTGEAAASLWLAREARAL